MEPHRRNRLKELIVEQQGSNALVLNDLMMADEGAKIFSELVPLHHRTLRLVELKGNNISPHGFELVCSALLDCQGIKSLLAEWNMIGLHNTVGLNALMKLVRNTPTLEHIDLKNNRIDHLTVQPICQLIRANLSWLKVLDFRWNELGEIGGRAILAALSSNLHLKVLDVHHNRIGEITMAAIEERLAMGAKRGTSQTMSILYPPVVEPLVFPISQNDYPDITTQTRLAEIRKKIEIEQRQGLAYRDKMQVQTNSVLSTIKLKGACMYQAQIRMQSLLSEQSNLKEQIKDTEQMFLMYRESTTKVGYEINVEQTDYRRGKYNLSRESQDLVKKLMDKNELEIADFSDQMTRKENHLAGLLSQRLLRKKDARDKLISLEDDCIRFNMERESLQHTTISKVVENVRKRFSDTFRQANEKLKEQQANINTLKRKNEYLNNELTQCVVRGLEKVRKLEGDIFDLQKKVKKLHDQMTHINLDIDSHNTKLELVVCHGAEKEQVVELLKRQVSNLMSQGNVMLDLVRQNQIEERKAFSQTSESTYARILQLEKAIRNQESSNKMVKNHYDKLCNMLQSQAQNAIYYTMTGATSIS